MKLVHATDFHLSRKGALVDRLDPEERVREFIDSVNRDHSDAALCVITGDLADEGFAESYDSLRTYLKTLKVPARLLLGNHDNREIFKSIFLDALTDQFGFVQSYIDIGEYRLVFLDTNEVNSHRGGYCERRRLWLEQTLSDTDGRQAILFMHHQPTDIGLYPVDAIGLIEQSAFHEILKRHREKICHIFFGHCHLHISGSIFGIPFSATRSTNHQTLLDFRQRDFISASHALPSYGVVLISKNTLVYHTIEFTYRGEAYLSGEVNVLTRDGPRQG